MKILKTVVILSILGSYLFGDNTPLRIAIKGEPSSLNPNNKRIIWDQFVANRLFDTLSKSSNNLKIVPSLLHSWSNPDSHTWIFKIRKGIKFHNGDMLTTKDIIFTLDRIKKKYKSYANIFAKISSYTIIDKYTFRVKTYNSVDTFKIFNNIHIVPSKYIQKVGEKKFALHPIGSGAYKYASGDTKELKLKRYENYWGKKANIENVIIKYIPSDKQYKALIDSEVDIVQNLNYEEFSNLKNNLNFKTFVKYSTLYHYLGMDVRRKKTPAIDLAVNPFRDKKIRLAIAKTIDLNTINKIVFKNQASILSQLSNSSVYGYNPNIKSQLHNIKKAKELMREAGYENGFEVTLHTPLGSREKIANIIAKQLKDINIKVKVSPIKDKKFWKEIFKKNHKYSFFLAGFSVGDSVEKSLNILFGARDGRGRLNFTGYSNPNFDLQLDIGAKSISKKRRLLALQKASNILAKDNPIIPLYNLPQFYGYNKRINFSLIFRAEIEVEKIKFTKKRALFDSIIDE